MKKILTLRWVNITILFIIIFKAGYGQQEGAIITGKISTVDGFPALGISVSLKGTSLGSVSAADGTYTIKRVKQGSYTLVATAVGLKPSVKKLLVDGDGTFTVDFSLDLNSEKLKEVVISANQNRYTKDEISPSLHLNEPLVEIPQNIQIISSQTLKDQQVLSMSDGVLRNVSGATRIEHWADLYARVNMRGARAGAFRNGVNISSDWGPLTEDMSFVDHIEFVKGPAGFMMSNGEPSGIYNVVTKKPTGKDFNGEAEVTVGSYDLYRTSVDLDGKFSKESKVWYRLNLMGQKKNSFRPNEYNNRYSIAPVLTFKLDDKTTLTTEYTFQYAKMSDLGSSYLFEPNGYGHLPRKLTTLMPGIEPTYIHDHSAFVNVQRELSSQWKLTGQLAYFNYTQQGTYMWPDAVNADGTMIRAVGFWDAKSSYKFGQLYLNGDVSTGVVHHRILAGLDLGNKKYAADFSQSHTLDSVGAEFDPRKPYFGVPVNGFPEWDLSLPIKQRPDPTISNQSYTGIYLQDELGFLDNQLRLTVAARYTYVKQQESEEPYDANHFTPRFGLSYSIDGQTSVYALLDQSFVPQTGTLRDGGNIKPITGNNKEVGIKRSWMNGKWSTTLTLYHILKNNELTADPANNGNESYSVVLGQTVTKGIEFDLKGELLPGLNLIANYAYTNDKVTKVTPGVTAYEVGQNIAGYATHNANAWLTYKLQNGPLKNLGFSSGGSFQADRDAWVKNLEGAARLPTYFRLDGGLFWERNNLRISGNIYNILDRYLYSGGFENWAEPSYYSYQVEAGTNLRVSVGYRF
ncbi:iron complex outermembrane recepter protein [bacterium A37T11]|nr:iron complex outermembrane recepter protein [bacterium A37T11]